MKLMSRWTEYFRKVEHQKGWARLRMRGCEDQIEKILKIEKGGPEVQIINGSLEFWMELSDRNGSWCNRMRRASSNPINGFLPKLLFYGLISNSVQLSDLALIEGSSFIIYFEYLVERLNLSSTYGKHGFLRFQIPSAHKEIPGGES